MNKVFITIVFIVGVIFFSSCGGDSSPGYEYMPNMYRSPSIETYGEHTIENFDGIPVEGTVARGHLSTFNYEGTLEWYLAAGGEVDDNEKVSTYKVIGKDTIYPAVNPLENNENNLADGKALYGMFCEHCHGATGAGDGTMTHAIYSAVPHYNDGKLKRRCGLPMCDLKAGHIFHAITYGLNAMGPHATQINEEERWKIVLYVQEELQHYGQE